MTEAAFEGWCILELMGHRRLAGYVSEQEIADSKMLGLDVHGNALGPDFEEVDGVRPGDKAITTQFYSPSAVYYLCLLYTSPSPRDS